MPPHAYMMAIIYLSIFLLTNECILKCELQNIIRIDFYRPKIRRGTPQNIAENFAPQYAIISRCLGAAFL